jgi:TonB family protein
MRVLVLAACLMVSPVFGAASLGEAERIVVAQAGGSATSGPRTMDDVRRVVDGQKGSIYALYASALRLKPGLQGNVRLGISIAPDGTVTKCYIASSSMKDPEFEQRLVEKFSKIRFGAKGDATFTGTYPLSFFTAAGKRPG